MKLRKLIFNFLMLIPWLLWPWVSYASFIETTLGTAVVNDATAAYFNPAALLLLKNTQFIPLGTVSRFRTHFTGETTSVLTGFTESGSSSSESNYYSPSFYFGMPINNRITLGFAAVSNFANRNPEENAILRYVQSKNTIQDYDFVPSIGMKLNDFLSLGGGINFSYTSFDTNPITGFPGSNIADSQSDNQSDGGGVGVNGGLLLKLMPSTLIGFDYRSVTTYHQTGKSVANGTTQVTSDTYRYVMRTPARSVFSISQRLTPALGMITTVQRVQWSIVRNIHVYGIATPSETNPIVDGVIPFYLHNAWILTLGGNYRFKPDLIVRLAGTYSQSPDSGYYQVSTGDSFILGTSIGYEINKIVTIDGSYAHAFIKDQSINVSGNRFLINGNNQGSRDSISLKLTFNV